jgi:hypothetical protein
VEVASASNILIIIYAIAYFIKKEGCYVVAFLFDETLTNLSCMDVLTDPQYYLMSAIIYCGLYWYIEKNIENKSIGLKTILACGIIVLFNAGMSIDAAINPTTETFMYSHYICFVVLLHLYLISTLIRWTLIGKSMERFVNACCNTFGISDAFAFLWYNTINTEN